MINVLIIEDEHAIRRFLRTALEADGMRVFVKTFLFSTGLSR